MASVRRFEDLEVWKRARELANLIYDLTDQETFDRDHGLKYQMRAAVTSIMFNIGEGFESRTQAMFAEYCGRAKASAGELRAQLYVALDRRYLAEGDFDRAMQLVKTCSRQLAQLIRYLESKAGERRFKPTVSVRPRS